MKRVIQFFVVVTFFAINSLHAQNITNTLGANGLFKVKDGSTDYLSISQSNGYLSLNKSLVLSNTTDASTGVIYKGTERFLHNYSPGSLFLGINSGNFSSTGSSNSAFGWSTLSNITSGYSNSAFGVSSLTSNLDGNYNSAFGLRTLKLNTSGSSNSAFGTLALESNTSGQENTAVGFQSLINNSIGSVNTSVGVNSLFVNSTGSGNSAFGYSALLANTTANSNSAFGYFALYSNTIGYPNSAFGTVALYSNVSGKENTAIGFKSLYSNVSGIQNTAVGDSALYNNTGNYNTAIGYNAGSNVTTGANLTLIGIDANPSLPTVFDEITLGNIYVNKLRCNATTITSLSDRRDKKNITDLTLGLDFLMKLKPRQFNWDKRDWYEDKNSDGSRMQETPTAGFVAQELDSIQRSENVEWLDLVLKSNPEKWETTPGNLFPIVVKAIQELNEKNDQLKIENEKLNERIANFEETQTLLVKKLEQIESKNELFKVQLVNTENINE